MRILAVAVLALASLSALAASAPGFGNGFGSAVDARRAGLGEPTDKAGRTLVKTLAKAGKALAAKKAARSLSNEIQAVAKATKLLETKAPDETALIAVAATAADAYETRLRSDLDILDTLAFADALPRKKGKAVTKAAKRAHGAADRVTAAAETGLRLTSLASLARVLEVLDPFDVTSGDEHAWIIDALTLAPAGTGLDLDGDGKVDNGLGAAKQALSTFGVPIDLDSQLAASIADGSLVFVVQMWRVNAFDNDPFVLAGTLSPEDGDGDPSDNFSGVEILTPQAGAVDAEGHAITRTATAFEKGFYEIAVDRSLSLPLGNVPVTVDGIVRVRASADELSNEGLLGLVVPGDAVRGFVNQTLGTGSPFVNLVMGVLLDIDTDHDGTKDAMSLALEFTSVPVGLE